MKRATGKIIGQTPKGTGLGAGLSESGDLADNPAEYLDYFPKASRKVCWLDSRRGDLLVLGDLLSDLTVAARSADWFPHARLPRPLPLPLFFQKGATMRLIEVTLEAQW